MRLDAKFRLDRFILSPSSGETPQFLPVFFGFRHSGVANWQQSEKVEHGWTTTNRPLSNGIKLIYVLRRLHGEIGRTISDVQKRDGQTNRQTKKTQRFWPPRRRVKSEPHQTWQVIEDIEHVLAPLKLLGV